MWKPVGYRCVCSEHRVNPINTAINTLDADLCCCCLQCLVAWVMCISTSRVSACYIVLMCQDFCRVGSALSPNEDVIQIQTKYTVRHNTLMPYGTVLRLSVRRNRHRAPLLQSLKALSTFTTCNSFVSEISLIYVMIWHDVFVNCNWVDTRWQ